MKTTHHTTLASVRDVNPESFDRIIKNCIHEAAQKVGKSIVIDALCSQSKTLALKQAA